MYKFKLIKWTKNCKVIDCVLFFNLDKNKQQTMKGFNVIRQHSPHATYMSNSDWGSYSSLNIYVCFSLV